MITYGLVVGIHVATFFVNITLVVISDFLGLLWVIGKKKVLPAKLMNIFHYLVWVGLTISIISGAYLFKDLSEFLLTVPAFYTKLFLVLALVINSFVIHSHMKVFTTTPFSEVEKGEKMKLIASGAVSFISWVGVYIAAQFLGV